MKSSIKKIDNYDRVRESIKSYNNFIKYFLIKESSEIEIWLSEKEILDLFQSFLDDEYLIDIEKIFSRSESEIDRDEIITKNDDIYLGWNVNIIKSQIVGTEDLTSEFKSILTQLKQNGYNISIQNDDSKIDENQIKINRGIFIKFFLLNTLDELNYISISLIQNEPQKFKTDKNIAEFYNWFGYESDKNGNIYFEISIEDLAYLFLNRIERNKGGYVDLLTNGIDRENYDSFYYLQDITNIINHELNDDQLEKLIKCLIKETGIDNIISEIDDISGESLQKESEIIQFLIKERFKKTLVELMKENDLELFGDIGQLIADYSLDAHLSDNEKEMYDDFDRILKKEGIDFNKEFKPGKRFYYSNNSSKTYYDDNIWVYKIYYQDRWLSDVNRDLITQDEWEDSLKNSNLEDIFNEWVNSEYFNHNLDPNYSDYGDVNRKSLNSEIDSILDRHLKS
jgi:hypothetical protein